jgi:lipid A ethanolaminephosphotransferase
VAVEAKIPPARFPRSSANLPRDAMFLRPRKRFVLSHLAFSLWFTALLYLLDNALIIGQVARWFPAANGIDYPALLAYLVFGHAFFLAFFLLFAHRWTIKPMAMLLVITGAAATYFIDKYHVAIDRSMVMNTLHTDPVEVTGLLSWQMLPYLLVLVILPLWFILRVEVRFDRVPMYLGKSLAALLLSLLIAVGALWSQYDSIHRAGNLSNKYIVHMLVPVNVIRSSLSVVQRSLQAWRRAHRSPVVVKGRLSNPGDQIVVLVVGESSRQKSFSLYGYERRDTNPRLAKIPGLFVLDGRARLGSTLLALPEILEKNGLKLTTVTSRLGVPTSCLVNYTLYDNCEEVGETRVSDCGHDGKCYDEDVIPLLRQRLANYRGGPELLVLHLGGGSHGPTYRDRYPPEFQKFNPQCRDADVINQCTPDELYNSYDNTILYVDHVLTEIIDTLQGSGRPYTMIYLSDHGESLLEDGRVFHGMPPGIALPPEQARIPLLVKSSLPIEIEPREAYRQPDVYDSVLQLLGIDVDGLDTSGAFIRRLP